MLFNKEDGINVHLP